MLLKRLMVGANFGGSVLELVGDLDLDGPRVGDESGLGIKRRLCSCLNSGLHVSLHINVLGEVS